MDFKDRIEKIKSILPLKFFYEKSFDTNARTKILSDIKLIGLDKESSILKCGILLTRQQELHLFRKYSYLRYRITKQTNTNLNKLKNYGLSEIENNIRKMYEARNIIIKCNMRLIVRPASKFYRTDSLKKDDVFSNGYMHMMNAIDLFDHRRGFKFSTYFTSVLYRNLLRDKTNLSKKDFAFLQNDPIDKRKIDYREINHPYNQQFIKEILLTVDKSLKNSRKSSKIRVAVLEKYFGLNGEDPKTLREIGRKFGFSKERIRQLVDDTIKIIRKLNFSYNPLN